MGVRVGRLGLEGSPFLKLKYLQLGRKWQEGLRVIHQIELEQKPLQRGCCPCGEVDDEVGCSC
jgi:hypothetical protein